MTITLKFNPPAEFFGDIMETALDSCEWIKIYNSYRKSIPVSDRLRRCQKRALLVRDADCPVPEFSCDGRVKPCQNSEST